MLSLLAFILISGVSWFVNAWWNPGRHRPAIVGVSAVRCKGRVCWAVRASHMANHDRGVSMLEIVERLHKERLAYA